MQKRLTALAAALCVMCSASAGYAQVDFNAMTLDEVKALANEAKAYYSEMTNVDYEKKLLIGNMLSESIESHLGGKVIAPTFGFDIERERDVYTVVDSFKVKNANNEYSKHTINAVIRDEGRLVITEFYLDHQQVGTVANELIVEYSVSASDFAKEIKKNKSSAAKKYNGKCIEITGEITDISKHSSMTGYYVCGKRGGSGLKVTCWVDAKNDTELSVGNTATFQGIVREVTTANNTEIGECIIK